MILSIGPLYYTLTPWNRVVLINICSFDKFSAFYESHKVSLMCFAKARLS